MVDSTANWPTSCIAGLPPGTPCNDTNLGDPGAAFLAIAVIVIVIVATVIIRRLRRK